MADNINIQQFIDALVESFVRDRFPSSAALQPELNVAVDAAVALAEKALISYGIAKLTAKVPV